MDNNNSFDLSQIQQVFITESNDLLEDMEACLLLLEESPEDIEVINRLFRAAHTIKGSAGLFSLNDIVDFTHNVESVLNQVRDGDVSIESELIALMLICRDHIQSLVKNIGLELSAELKTEGERLLSRLAGFDKNEITTKHESVVNIDLIEKEKSSLGKDVFSSDSWYISVRFGRDSMRNGMDPASTLLFLGTLGKIAKIALVDDALPGLSELDAESCYLGFEIQFIANPGVRKTEVNEAFDFVREDSIIHIFPPNSAISDVLIAINEMPEGAKKIGEILVDVGILSEAELSHALDIQQREKYLLPSGSSGAVRSIGEILVEQGMANSSVVDAALGKQRVPVSGLNTSIKELNSVQKPQKINQDSSIIKLDSEKLDNLINLVGELVIAGASTELFARRTGDDNLIESTQSVLRLVEEIRDAALNMRMVQIGATFNRFQRVVRDISKSLGKDVELVITGADAELDKSVVEKIGDPLMHLIRNSLDHGIESSEIRIASGKNSKSEIRLNAYHDSGSIVLEVSDDGGGLNTEKILEKAISKGLVSQEAELSEKDIYSLIFEPGFSTADHVTDISGRGVGMDVVRRNIEALRGSIEIESIRHKGTTTRIRLPLTLAIIDGFLVGVSSSSYIIPLDMVVECVNFDHSNKNSNSYLDKNRGSNYISMRGEVLPFIRLKDHFNHHDDSKSKRENIVIVKNGDKKFGLVVDSLRGETQAVIKPLGKMFEGVRGIGGSTILGSGEVALVLEVQGLISEVVSHSNCDIKKN